MNLRLLLDKWIESLKAENKSPNTIRNYRDGVRYFLDWYEEPELTKDGVRRFLNYRLNTCDLEPSTVASNRASICAFARWLHAEGYTESNILTGLKQVKVPEKVMESLEEWQARALLNACRGPSFVDVRDFTICVFMLDTCTRAEETVSIHYPRDLNMSRRTATVRKGKGSTGHVVGFTKTTAEVLSAYLTIRADHPRASDPELWLGGRGHTFGYKGLYAAIKTRGESAGIEVNPHQLRATGASHFLDHGGSVNDLMSRCDWKDERMPARYTKASSAKRAHRTADRIDVVGRLV